VQTNNNLSQLYGTAVKAFRSKDTVKVDNAPVDAEINNLKKMKTWENNSEVWL